MNRDYRLIYQLYVNSETTIPIITIDGQMITSLDISKQKFNQFDYYQIPVNLPVNKDHVVIIKFETPISISTEINQTAYSLTEIRQSGINDLGYGLIINLPENTLASLVSSPVDTKPHQIFYRYPTKTSTFGLGLGLVRQ